MSSGYFIGLISGTSRDGVDAALVLFEDDQPRLLHALCLPYPEPLKSDLDEWLAYWQLALEDDARYEREVEALTDRLFSVFDLDEDDGIGKQEFADFYGIFGLPVHLAETVFAELDGDDDGRMTRDELRAAARSFFRSDDIEESGNLLFGPYGA